MSDVFGSLSHIENGLERLRRERLRGALRPGLNEEDVCGQRRAAGLPSNAALEAVYSWRDGTTTDGVVLDDIHIFPGFYLLSLEDAIANYRAFLASPRWSPGWLPVFANGGGDFYLVDLHGELSGSVRHFRIEESEHPVEFRSLPDMLGTLAAGFGRGLFYTDADGYLEMDDLLFAALAAELNPGVPWWTD